MEKSSTVVRRRENTPRQAALWKVSGSFLSKLLGFARDVLLAKVFGATYVTDVAQLVENVLLSIVTFITSPIAIPLVPELTQAQMRSERDYRSLLSSVFGLFSIVGGEELLELGARSVPLLAEAVSCAGPAHRPHHPVDLT